MAYDRPQKQLVASILVARTSATAVERTSGVVVKPWIAVLAATLASAHTLLAQTIAVHPTAENLRVAGVVATVGMRDSVSGIAELDQMGRRLRSAIRVDSIGTVDGALPTVLGTIMDVAIDPTGRVFVLDVANENIRVFDSAGKPQFVIGQRGNGPLDFRFPVAIWSEGVGRIVVVDAQLGAKYLTVGNGRTVQLDRVVPLAGSPTGACGSGGNLYAYSPSLDVAAGVSGGIEKVVRMHASNGRLVRNMGESYQAASPLVRGIMSEGTVACIRDGSTLFTLSKLPFVHGYDSTGTRRWSLRLTDFVIGRQIERKNENGHLAIGSDPKDPTASYVRRMTPLGARFVAVQVGLMTPQSLRDRSLWSKIDTYLVDVQAQKSVFVSSSLPLLSTVNGNSLVGFDNDPFPRVIRLAIAK